MCSNAYEDTRTLPTPDGCDGDGEWGLEWSSNAQQGPATPAAAPVSALGTRVQSQADLPVSPAAKDAVGPALPRGPTPGPTSGPTPSPTPGPTPGPAPGPDGGDSTRYAQGVPPNRLAPVETVQRQGSRQLRTAGIAGAAGATHPVAGPHTDGTAAAAGSGIFLPAAGARAAPPCDPLTPEHPSMPSRSAASAMWGPSLGVATVQGSEGGGGGGSGGGSVGGGLLLQPGLSGGSSAKALPPLHPPGYGHNKVAPLLDG